MNKPDHLSINLDDLPGAEVKWNGLHDSLDLRYKAEDLVWITMPGEIGIDCSYYLQPPDYEEGASTSKSSGGGLPRKSGTIPWKTSGWTVPARLASWWRSWRGNTTGERRRC